MFGNEHSMNLKMDKAEWFQALSEQQQQYLLKTSDLFFIPRPDFLTVGLKLYQRTSAVIVFFGGIRRFLHLRTKVSIFASR